MLGLIIQLGTKFANLIIIESRGKMNSSKTLSVENLKMKKAIIVMILIITILFSFMMVNTARFTSKQIEVAPSTRVEADLKQAANNLSQAIQLKTISTQDKGKFDPSVFKTFHQFLENTFPKIHSHLHKQVINDYSLIYTWKGSDDNLKPIILMAHMDVVPVETDTETEWTYPPFEGRIAENFVWGRGSLDDKVSLLAIMEAVEILLDKGFNPSRTLYLAFGHDEEFGGPKGGSRIAAFLKSKMVKAEWILDEGGVIASGLVPGVSKPVALVGIAEKGYMTLELSVQHEGGHSSMPPPENAIGILSSAIHNLERNPFPAKLEGATLLFFNTVGPEMPLSMRFLLANQWLFFPLIKSQLKKSNTMNALIRTTIAPTVIKAGSKENVLPQIARAKINFRLYPGDSAEYVIGHVKKAINDPRVHVSRSEHAWNEASFESDVKSESFMVLQRTISQAFPDSIVAPFLMVAGTDTKHYAEISDNIFRFLPVRLASEDLKRIHGTNERLKLENYQEIIKFYIQLIRNSN
jgi:carboxypeptidase PM20D1